MIHKTNASVALLIIALLFTLDGFAAPGGKKAGATNATTGTVIIDKIEVNRPNAEIVVTGSGFSGATFTLSSNAITPVGSDTLISIPFDALLASIVTNPATYVLSANGMPYPFYIDGPILDPSASGCPCQSAWESAFLAEGITANATEACVESGTDIATTLYTDPSNPNYPLYAIGAAYVSGDPASSVCQLVKIDSVSPFVSELVNMPLNATQQGDCAAYMKANPVICP